jgi:conserved hypothethical protein
MKLNRIEQIYKGLRNDNETYYIFDYSKNGVVFNILFDIYYSPFRLHFLAVKEDFSFVIDVNKGFIISPSLSKEDYIRLCKVLNLKYDENNPFSPKLFFEEFNANIPSYSKKEYKKESYTSSIIMI